MDERPASGPDIGPFARAKATPVSSAFYDQRDGGVDASRNQNADHQERQGLGYEAGGGDAGQGNGHDLILACVFFAGWARWPWWTPFATFAVAVRLMLSQMGSGGAPEAVAILLVTLVLFRVPYGLGFGASRLFRD